MTGNIDWFDLIFPPVLALVYGILSAFYLAFLNPRGQVVKYRKKMILYGTGFMVVFGYSMVFNQQLRVAWQAWFWVFVIVAIGILVWGIITEAGQRQVSPRPTVPSGTVGQSPSRRQWKTWQEIGLMWLIVNLIALWVQDLFRRGRLP